MKIGLYFGSFNPIHNGHLNMANYVTDCLNLDKLLFIVSPNNPFKNPRNLCDVMLRIDMVASATDNNPKLEVSDVEVNMPKPSYTIDTLHKLFEKYGSENEFYIIMGLDNWVSIDKWRLYEDILKLVTVIVLPRMSSSINSLSECSEMYEKKKCELERNLNIKSIFLRDAPTSIISSTFIRNNIENKTLIKEYIPESVFNIIDSLKLYCNGS